MNFNCAEGKRITLAVHIILCVVRYERLAHTRIICRERKEPAPSISFSSTVLINV